jgi:hypothetical protein
VRSNPGTRKKEGEIYDIIYIVTVKRRKRARQDPPFFEKEKKGKRKGETRMRARVIRTYTSPPTVST